MIKWITPRLGTAAWDAHLEASGAKIVDVRDLLDGRGNVEETVRGKIDQALSFLGTEDSVVIACDYGMSRSNAVAVGVLVLLDNVPFAEATRRVMEATGETATKIEVLSTVRKVVERHRPNRRPAQRPNERILITGATGFIGRNLSGLLASRTVFSPGRDEIDLREGCVALDLFVRENSVDCIIHLANPRIYTVNSAMGETVAMLKNVIDVCVASGVKLIFPSSWVVYSGYRSELLLAAERLPRLAKGCYGETKHLCEILIEHCVARYSLDCAIVRISPVYGPGGFTPRFIHSFLAKANRGEPIVTHRYLNGFPKLDLMYVTDLCAALKGLIETGLSGVLNLGSGKATSTFEAAETIVDLVNSPSTISHTLIQDYAPNILMDTTRAHSELQWQPRIDLTEGLKTIIKGINSGSRSRN